MAVVLELLLLAVIGATIEVWTLRKVKYKEQVYIIAFIMGIIMALATLFIFKING